MLLGVEPELDCGNPRAAMSAMRAAEFVVAMSAYRTRAVEYAHVLLPIAPFTETSGTFVNTEGRMQSFNGVVRPLEDARPAWKVLRVLGNLIGLAGFDYDTSEQVRDETCKADAVAARLDNRVPGLESGFESGLDLGRYRDRRWAAGGLQRIADVPIYFADPIVRRAASLQQTRDARMPKAWMNPALAAKLGVVAGAKVRVRQEGGEAVLELACDERLPAGLRAHCGGPSGDRGFGRDVRRDHLGGAGLEWISCFNFPLRTPGPVAGLVRAGVGRPSLHPGEDAGPDRAASSRRSARRGGLPDALGAQAHRLDAGAPRAEPRRPARAAAADRRRHQAGVQGNHRPAAASSKVLFVLGPLIAVTPAMAAWAVMPFSPEVVLADVNAGLLYMIAMTSMGVYGVIIAGWASNSKYAFLGAMRSAAQIVSYEIAMGFALVCVLMVSHSLNLSDIVAQQGRGMFADMGLNFLSWNWLPLAPMLLVYFISGVAETNRAPFDVVEGESEIVAGHMVEYSGMAFALFILAEYANMILIAIAYRDHVLRRLGLADRQRRVQRDSGLRLAAGQGVLHLLAVPVVPRHVPALSLRPDHAPGLESVHSADHRLAGADRRVDADAVVDLQIGEAR